MILNWRRPFYVFVDLEATCWEGACPFDYKRQEVIEIGAVFTNGDFDELSHFASFVRPAHNTTLTEFCTKLTGITQSAVDEAPTFGEVFFDFLNWLPESRTMTCFASWGDYDWKGLRFDCEVSAIDFKGETFGMQHVNIKKRVKKWCLSKNHFHKSWNLGHVAIEHGLILPGKQHRALNDARAAVMVVKDIGDEIFNFD
jgi:inhibitor of KinA sporulation pathway (predicted exonuclease)